MVRCVIVRREGVGRDTMHTKMVSQVERNRPPHPVTIGVIGVAYFLTAKLGLTLDAVSGFAAVVWPPSGIALAVILLLGPRAWPGIALGAFAINASVGAPWLAACGIALGNTLEAVMGAWWLRWSGFRVSLDRVQDVLQLVFYSALLSTTISATIGTSSLLLTGVLSLPTFGPTWQAWWTGDILGVLLVAPPLLAWGLQPRVAFRLGEVFRAIPCLVSLGVIASVVFGGVLGPRPPSTIAYLIFPPLIWVSLRFHLRAATTAMLVTSGIAVWGVMQGTSPFLGETITHRLMLLQLFMGVAALTTLVLAATVAERRRSERVAKESEQALRRAHDELELRVHERTAELSHANAALHQGRTQLDQRVQERTAELAKANTLLKSSLDARREAEEELRRARDELERRVAERTASLAKATADVQGELAERTRIEAQLRQAHEALRTSEEQFRAVVETARDAIVSANTQGCIISWNSGAEAIFGYRGSEVMGKPLTMLMPERFHEAHTQGLRRLLAGGTSKVLGTTLELAGVRKDGIEFPLELSLSSWETSLGRFFTAIIRDIAERKQAEQQLTRTNELLVQNQTELLDALVKVKRANEELQATQMQLFQAAKLESVGRLAAGVAHEVKNPLATLLIGIDHLADHVPIADGDVSLLLQDMQRAVRKADAVIKGLLDFSTPETLALAEEDVREVIDQSVRLMTHEFARNHVVVVKEWAASLPRLRLDRSKMEQVFINLFMNAVHAMPEGGTLTIRTSVKRLRTPGSKRGRRQDDLFRLGGTVVVMMVEDTGVGIPPEKLPKIFDPFFTTKPTGKGTGLGLTVSRKIVELHGGTIDIHNRPEGGVRATLMFSAERGRHGPWTENGSS
ncbi:MAG: MASE1 domain-containing protein [Candidatus Omnitrophica bacterium]|nr:MASE1 domain-containing protein [Candidatus Omnitrophota bacterium]